MDPETTMITVTIDGKPVQVAKPEGVFTQDEVKAAYVPKTYFETEVARRLKGKVSKQDLIADEDFVAEVASAHGLSKAGDSQQNLDEFRTKLTAEFERTKLSPITAKAAKLEAEVAKLRGSTLQADILQAAAAAGLKKSLLSATVGQPMAVGLFANQFGFDEETGNWYLRDGNGFAPSASGKTPYVTASEFVSRWANDPANRDFVESAQGAPTPSPTRGTPTSGEPKSSKDLISSGLSKLGKS